MLLGIINFINLKRKKVAYGSNFRINGVLRLHGRGKIDIGENVILNCSCNSNSSSGNMSMHFTVYDGAVLTIGNNVGISQSCITAREKVVIDDNVLIGAGCMIADNDFHSLDYRQRQHGNDVIIARPIYISKNAFIGARTIILKGVSIGENSIIGAGSVVTKSVPSNEIWAGNPARFIRKI